MKITEIQIFTDNLKQTERFYTTVLELKILSKKENSISFSAGHSVLTFIKSQEEKPVYHFAFNIPNNKLNEAITCLSSKTELIKTSETEIIADFKAWNAKAVYFFDNNGNILEFIARFDSANASEIPFTGSSILSISEIAIATDDVEKLADKLVSEIKMPVFPKQPLFQNFGAFGDDSGLIIISKTDRNWYPTKIPAKSFNSKIKISINGMIRDISVDAKGITSCLS
jgi:catechol 2,3-dioxygenase-like lactoylglutathione lyase family enzyme